VQVGEILQRDGASLRHPFRLNGREREYNQPAKICQRTPAAIKTLWRITACGLGVWAALRGFSAHRRVEEKPQYPHDKILHGLKGPNKQYERSPCASAHRRVVEAVGVQSRVFVCLVNLCSPQVRHLPQVISTNFY
jgi:hypothetical protein